MQDGKQTKQRTPADDAKGGGEKKRPRGLGVASASGGIDPESEVTPEEQAAYEKFVTKGMELMYQPDVMPGLLRVVHGEGNQTQGLAQAVSSLVIRLEDAARDAGEEIDGPVKYHGGVELLEQLVELSEAAGMPEFSEESMENALYLALDLYRQQREAEGTLPEGELAEDMAALIEAEERGDLDEILPGVEKFAKQAPQPEPEQLEAAMAGMDQGGGQPA